MDEPVRVAFIVPNMTPGGAERQFLTLMRNLDRRRFEPILISLNLAGPLFDEAVASGIEAHFLDTYRVGVFSTVVRCTRLLRSRRVRVALMRGFSATVIGRIASVFARVPVRIVAEHSHGWVERPPLWKVVVERMLSLLTTHFVAVCEAQVEFLVGEKGLPQDRITVIPNGIEMPTLPEDARVKARQKLGLTQDQFVVGIVAVMRPEKDHRTFLEAARLLVDKTSDARFVLVGDGPCRADIEQRVSDLGLGDQVVLTGSLSDVISVVAAFDVFTLSSMTEAFPLAVLEAMSCGIPVVASRVGGLPEMVDEGSHGLLVPPGDPAALCTAWVSMYANRELRLHMGWNAARRVRSQYCACSMTRSYENLFSCLLEA